MREGWATAKLGDVCQMIKRGIAPKYTEEGGVCVINQKCVRNHAIDYDQARRHWTDQKKINAERYIKAGDVLVNSTGTGTLGRVAQVRKEPPEPTTVDTHVTIVRPEPGKFFEDFFGYMLIMVEDQIASSGEGTSGQTELARTTLQNKFDVSFPHSIPEQKRNVAILDEAFEGIGRAAANAEKNLANARELFESYLQSSFADAWRTCDLVTLADLATDITDGDHMPPPKAPSGVPFITIRNIDKKTLNIDFSDTFRVPREYFDGLKPNRKPKLGDVLYTVTGSLGVPVLIRENCEFCFQRHIGLVRPKPEVDSEWLYYLLMSPKIYEQANQGATGTAQKTVSLKLLRGFQVPRVPLSEQRTLAAKLNSSLQQTQLLGSAYQKKLAALTELKQSILQKAFSGELTAQPNQALKEAVA